MRTLKNTFSTLVWVGAMVLFVGALAGCGKAPEQEINDTRSVFASARQSGAEEYAPELWTKAQIAMSAAEAELDAQSGKSSMTRRYGTAKQLLAEARAAAEEAGREAESRMNELRNQSAELLQRLRDRVGDTRSLLQSEKGQDLLTTPRVGRALEALARENDELASSADEIERMIESGRFAESMRMARSATDHADAVHMETEEAVRTGQPPRLTK